MSRSQLCLCTFRPRRSPPVWCIKIPSAYVVAQAGRFRNEGTCRSCELRCSFSLQFTGRKSSQLVAEECGREKRTWVRVPTPLGISPVSVNLSGPPDSGAKATCEWDQRINLTVAFVVFLFLALVSSLCCSSAVKQTLRSRRRTAAVSWDQLVLCLDAGCRHQGPLERISPPQHHQYWVCIALTCPQSHVNFLTPLQTSSLRLALMQTRWCRAFRFCLFIRVECWLVFYPGARVSLCRHVCVPPISDCALILYMD